MYDDFRRGLRFLRRGCAKRPAMTVVGGLLLGAIAFGAGEAEAQVRFTCPSVAPTISIIEGGSVENEDGNRVIQVDDNDYITGGELVRDPEKFRALYRAVGGQVVRDLTQDIYCRYGRAETKGRALVVLNPALIVAGDFLPAIEALYEGSGNLEIYAHSVSEQFGSAANVFSYPFPLDYARGIFTTGNTAYYETGEASYGIHAKHTGEGRVGIDVRNLSVRTTGNDAYGVYGWQEGSYVYRDEDGNWLSPSLRCRDEHGDWVAPTNCVTWDNTDNSYTIRTEEDGVVRQGSGAITRARGAVVVNLIETDRDREQRVRPLVGTRGDQADAVRAEYTRAAAYGHIAVTVEGYDIATGGIVPIGAVGTPRRDLVRDLVFDPDKPFTRNSDYDPTDPDSPEFVNIAQFIRLNKGLTADFRPYTLAYLPVRNPNHDPEDPDSREFFADPQIVIWNGRYFRALDESLSEDVAYCQALETADDRRACYVERIDGAPSGSQATGFQARGIYASHEGHGDIRVRATDNNIRTWGDDAQGIYATHTGRTRTETVCTEADPDDCVGEGASEGETVVTPGGGGISIVVTGGDIATEGEDSHGIWARHRGDSGADDNDGTVDPNDIGTGNIAIAVTDAAIATTGNHARGVYGLIQQTIIRSRKPGCTGHNDDCFVNELVDGTGVGDIDIAVTGGSIDTTGIGGAYAVQARHENEGSVAVRLTGVAAATAGEEAHGVFAEHRGAKGNVAVTVDGGSVTTKGADAHGIHAINDGSGDLAVELSGSVKTEGERANAVFVQQNGAGSLAFRMTGGEATTAGDYGHGVHLYRSTAGSGSINIADGEVRAAGSGSLGVLADFSGAGTVSITVGEGASVSGGLAGIQVSTSADANGNVPTGIVRVDGDVTGGNSGVILSDGGTVTVGRTGRVISSKPTAIFSSGSRALDATVAGTVEGNIHALGDLTASVTGMVTGDILGDGSGDHTVTVHDGGTVGGTIQLAASEVTVAGTAGRVWLEKGGTVTVSGTGSITGIEGEAVRSDAEDLTANLAGMLTGDVLALGTGKHRVTVAEGGTVTGAVRVATRVGEGESALTVNGAVGRVMIDEGGAFTVGPKGRINPGGGDDVIAVSSERGDIKITIQESPDEMSGEAVDRVKGRILAAEGQESVDVRYQPFGSTEPIKLGRLGTTESAPSGAYDLGLETDGSGGVRVVRELAPRARVYEALPSVLLGMTRLTNLRDRMTAPRDAKGVWARVYGSHGKWKAASSTTSELEYYRNSGGFQGGLDTTIRDGLFGVSVHHRRGQADISKGGKVDLFGVGAGISGTWRRDDVYVDVQGETTFYETDLSSSLRGDLKKGARGRSHALGVEVGRRSDQDGVVVVPRFGLTYARVSWPGFTDKVTERVSADGSVDGPRISADGQSLKGRGGVTVEGSWDGNPDSRWSGSIDLEHELRDETTVNVSGTNLKSEAEATWLRLGLKGIHVWGDGRYTLQSGLSYAATDRVDSYEVGGEMNLKVRF